MWYGSSTSPSKAGFGGESTCDERVNFWEWCALRGSGEGWGMVRARGRRERVVRRVGRGSMLGGVDGGGGGDGVGDGERE